MKQETKDKIEDNARAAWVWIKAHPGLVGGFICGFILGWIVG